MTTPAQEGAKASNSCRTFWVAEMIWAGSISQNRGGRPASGEGKGARRTCDRRWRSKSTTAPFMEDVPRSRAMNVDGFIRQGL